MTLEDKVHVPTRTCLVCGRKKPKFHLQRLALHGPTAMVVVDREQRLHGRGAYVCPDCLPRLTFNKRLQRAFRSRAKGLAQEKDPSFSQNN